jgi:hypothetical protein
MALLLTLVGVTLSALLAPMVVAQIGSTRATVERTDALNAAQAGLDVALGQIRAANDGNGNGAPRKLPCGPLAGSVGSVGYTVEIIYLSADPRSGETTNAIACTPGNGVASAPSYAVLESTGTAGPRSRKLELTYRFKVTDQPIRGGLIHVTGTDRCLDAGSDAPGIDTNLVVQPCSPGNPRQQFAYGRNLNLYLASTRKSDTDLGRCLDAGAPHAAGPLVQFAACASPTKAQQQWSLDDAARLHGTKDGTNLDDFCFYVTSPIPGSTVVLKPCQIGTSFSPEAAVGAGAARPSSQPAAGASPKQLVNLSQFGRCMDVTEFNPTKGYLIVWPCKQAPNPANVGWNQKWTLPAIASGETSASGPIFTDATTGRYCLRSPGPFQYVTVALCPANLAQAQQWTVYGDIGYALRYHIQDEHGYCLSPTDPNATPPDFYPEGYQVSKIVVADCNQSRLQRWNSTLDGGLEGLSEK